VDNMNELGTYALAWSCQFRICCVWR